MTKIHLNKNVYDATLDRIRYLFDEFDTVSVGISGGKDSTVVFNLAMQVAKEKKKLPLHVLFIDQEAEWNFTIDEVRKIMYRKDVKPYWYQMPIHIENATSNIVNSLYCWEEGKDKDWIRPKEKISIKENTYGVEWWKGIFDAIFIKDFPKGTHCNLSGVRTEESPGRFIGLTSQHTYKGITWGTKSASKTNHFAFYPLYDWSYTDIWKAIYDNKWSYNKLYDYQYRYGTPIQNMRVSNLHHETAVRALFYLQEIDGDLYNKLVERLPGVDTAGKMGFDDFWVKKLPFMFNTWAEYRDHLIKHLVHKEDWKKDINKFVTFHDKLFKGDEKWDTKAAKQVCQCIITNDYALTKLRNFAIITQRYKRDLRDYEVIKNRKKSKKTSNN